jgi:septum formation protein
MPMITLAEKFKNTRIILASASPRRKYLLGELGIKFEVLNTGGIDESWPGSLSKKQIPVYLAVRKSDVVENIAGEDILVISADTIVWCRKKVLNKPSGREEAISMLMELSGRKHKVITGVCLRGNGKTVTFCSVTSVFFRDLTMEEVVYYVENYQPYDKAGAYGIQEWIGYTAIEAIKGSYFNVMGLPVARLYQELVDF